MNCEYLHNSLRYGHLALVDSGNDNRTVVNIVTIITQRQTNSSDDLQKVFNIIFHAYRQSLSCVHGAPRLTLSLTMHFLSSQTMHFDVELYNVR